MGFKSYRCHKRNRNYGGKDYKKNTYTHHKDYSYSYSYSRSKSKHCW